MTTVITDLQEWCTLRKSLKGTVGFVPTMGALHEGHAALFRRSRRENEISVVSIFVNPTQFNNPNDFTQYPIRHKEDLNCAECEKVDYLLCPKPAEIYADDYNYKVTESRVSSVMEGAHRPGHFDGVLTVVMKLFNLVKPERAYFGEKDYQQLLLIKGMSEALFMDINVVACPTVREDSGLALSSRNLRLSEVERTQLAPHFYRILRAQVTPAQAREQLETLGFRVDYVEDHEGRRFGAAFVRDIRLIDNVQLQTGAP